MKLLPRRFVRDAAYLLPSQRLRGGILLPSPRVIRASAGSPPPAGALLFSADSVVPNSLNKLSALQASCTIRAVAGCIAATGDALIFLAWKRRSPGPILVVVDHVPSVGGTSFGGCRDGRPGAIGSLAGNVSSSDSSRKSSCSCADVSVLLCLLAVSTGLIISIPLMRNLTNLASLAAGRH
jgi:hypothetical protein